MSSGEGCNIMYPEMAFVTAKALILALPDQSATEGERIAFCSYLHIAMSRRFARPSGVQANQPTMNPASGQAEETI